MHRACNRFQPLIFHKKPSASKIEGGGVSGMHPTLKCDILAFSGARWLETCTVGSSHRHIGLWMTVNCFQSGTSS